MNLDVSKDTKNLQNLLDLAGISKEKVSRKNRPTFLTICDEKISKIAPIFFNEKFDDFSQTFEKEFC